MSVLKKQSFDTFYGTAAERSTFTALLGDKYHETDTGLKFVSTGAAWIADNSGTSIVGSLTNQPFTEADLVAGVRTFSQTQNGLYLRNKGLADLTFTINGETYTLEPSFYFDERLAPYTVIAIASTGAVVCYGYGRV